MNPSAQQAPPSLPVVLPARQRAPKSLIEQIADDLDEAARYNDSAEVRLRPRERDTHVSAEHAQ